MRAPQISVVSPVYKCERCLEALVSRIGQAMTRIGTEDYEVILVDDRSPDEGWAQICRLARTNKAVRGVRLSRNFGQHAAISAGLEVARGEVTVVMDCDLQDRPEEIPRLVEAVGGDIHMAIAQRSQRQDGPLKKLSSWMFYKTLGWLTETTFDNSTANFGAYSRRAVDAYNSISESHRVFPLIMKWTGLPAVLIAVEHDARGSGKSSYNLKKLLSLSFHIALSFSDKPLRLVVNLAVLFALFALGLVIFSIARFFAGDVEVAGFTSVIASIWLVGSAVIGCLGVIGLYIGRVFNEVKARPSYIVADTCGNFA